MSNHSPLNLLTHRAVEKAVAAERRRIARDLHDGLAQELAFISLQSHRLAEVGGVGTLELAEAADRALYEVRNAIERFSEETNQTFPGAIAETARRLTARSETALELDIDQAVELEREHQEGLLRILTEAISNGIRHGNATKLGVELACDSGVRMVVADNGTGFDPDEGIGKDGSYGILSMIERARDLGGRLTLQSWPGIGTAVEVSLP